MVLEEYKRKRKFGKNKTPEPKPRVAKAGKKLVYAIQEHWATRHHHDLRLEHKGVLLSWALPKGPPKSGEKRLAIQTEDHPLAYAKFAGRIPEGHYGAGLVKIWDSGFHVPETIKANKIVTEIKGRKLKGRYVLIKTAFRGAKNSWLFFKGKE